MTQWLKRLFILLVLAAAIGGGGWYYLKQRAGATSVQFRTASVARGDITQEVMANGSLNAVTNVQVGSQVSGIIEKINVDYNSTVKEGDVIAQIDPSTYQQNLVQAEAELAQSQSAMELTQIEARRAEQLFKEKLISASDHDTAEANYHQAQAVLKTKEASLYRAKVDLSRTTITAPISGIVISRAVDQGQTVAASFNTPTLFLIANDLTKMQIEAAVSEADVGGVDEGEKVTFSVEAFPNRKFLGQVAQVRFAPITNQNVVTYTAVVKVDNKDLKLRPGMTATARIMTAQRTNVMRVPNAALRLRVPAGVTLVGVTNSIKSGSTNRTGTVAIDSNGMPIPPWRAENRRPTPEEREKFEASLTPEQRERYQQMVQQMRQRFAEGGGGPGGLGPGGPGGGASQTARRSDGPTTATVYLLESSGGAEKEKPVLRAVTVKAGITDGTNTEILEGLKEGDLVVTGATATTAATTNEPPRNPFMPFGGGPRR
jgi:HlyD family secretion protein